MSTNVLHTGAASRPEPFRLSRHTWYKCWTKPLVDKMSRLSLILMSSPTADRPSWNWDGRCIYPTPLDTIEKRFQGSLTSTKIVHDRFVASKPMWIPSLDRAVYLSIYLCIGVPMLIEPYFETSRYGIHICFIYIYVCVWMWVHIWILGKQIHTYIHIHIYT